MGKTANSELVSNRKAFHDYTVFDTFEAGIVLLGTEIKSLRNHGGSLQDAYVDVLHGELWLMQASIAPYAHGNIHNHEERRPRKLLMHKREIEKLARLRQQKNMTLIPLSMYLSKGKVKVKIATARGKRDYDKRAALKAQESTRSIKQALENS